MPKIIPIEQEGQLGVFVMLSKSMVDTMKLYRARHSPHSSTTNKAMVELGLTLFFQQAARYNSPQDEAACLERFRPAKMPEKTDYQIAKEKGEAYSPLSSEEEKAAIEATKAAAAIVEAERKAKEREEQEDAHYLVTIEAWEKRNEKSATLLAAHIKSDKVDYDLSRPDDLPGYIRGLLPEPRPLHPRERREQRAKEKVESDARKQQDEDQRVRDEARDKIKKEEAKAKREYEALKKKGLLTEDLSFEEAHIENPPPSLENWI